MEDELMCIYIICTYAYLPTLELAFLEDERMCIVTHRPKLETGPVELSFMEDLMN